MVRDLPIEDWSDDRLLDAHRSGLKMRRAMAVPRPEFPAPPTPGHSYDMSSGGSAGSGSTVSTGRGVRRRRSVSSSGRAAPARRATFDGGRIARPPPPPPDLTNWVTVLGAGRTTPLRAEPLDEHFWENVEVPYPPVPRYVPDTTPDPARPLSKKDKAEWEAFYKHLITRGVDPDGNPIPDKDLIAYYKRLQAPLEDVFEWVKPMSDAEILKFHRGGRDQMPLPPPSFPPPEPGHGPASTQWASFRPRHLDSIGRPTPVAASSFGRFGVLSSTFQAGSGRVSGSGDMDISPSTSMSISGSGSHRRRRRRSDTGSASGGRSVRRRPNPPSGSSTGGAAQRRVRKAPKRKTGRKRATMRRG
ncbi:hypothetical protein WJX74_005902 [Apatococcus lobatus]|uniref:Uncharacterized protein n=1 Tax=Apatococcus lobatus TaxID=904363 RepID=A0AAW1Q2C2_9CHLO